jgi:hypothetical protein
VLSFLKVSAPTPQADPQVAENPRHRCRNCRAKLPAPVTNAREAFCGPGCHGSFFRTRCRVCEEPIEQPPRGTRIICNKARCRNARRAGLDSSRYPTSITAEPLSERPVNKGPKVGISDDRASSWRVIAAGAPISANQYHCAVVGAAEAVATVSRTNAAHWANRKLQVSESAS